MNKQRRKKVEGVFDQLQAMIMELEEIRDGEQDAFDNLPEGIQESERGEQMEEYISQMKSAIDDMENAKSSLEEVFNS